MLECESVANKSFIHVIDNSSTEEGSGNINFGDADIQSCCKLFLGIQNCYGECINVSGTRHNRG